MHAKSGNGLKKKTKESSSEMGHNMKGRKSVERADRERIRTNFKVYIELAVAAPEDLNRIVLALPPWPINVKLSGSREAIRLWKRKTH